MKKRILSIGLKIALFSLVLLFASSILISIPAVQTRIINRLSDAVFEKINHNLDIEYINIRWFDTILINGLLVYDTKNRKMIKVDRLILDFKLGELITRNSVNLDKAILQGASVEMLKNGPEGQFNLNFFIDEIKNKLIRKKKRKDAKFFHTDKIILTDGRFKMYRDDRELITYRFDQYHFTLNDLDANLTDFILKPGTIDFNVTELQCVDSATGLDVKDLQTKFQYTRQSMVFQNMEMKAGRSTISQSMVFNYLQPSSVKEFVDSVKITANVKKSLIYSRDLAHFAPSLKKYNEYYHLEGFMEGPVKRFNAQNITLRFGLHSELRGYISMYGLPNFNETFIDAKITDGRVNMGDMAPYVNEESMENLQKFGVVKIRGGFSGFPVDFVSNATFETEIGWLDTDINLKLGTNKNERPTYSGKLVTQNFDLGILTGDTTLLQSIDMSGSINGSGFSREDVKFDLVSTIDRIGINGYDYRNIQTDAIMAEQFFKGNLIIDDPNLQFNGNVSVDLNKQQEIIQVKAELGKAVLDTLKITDKPAYLSSSLNVDMRGLTIDEILGEAYLENTVFKYNGKELFLDRLSLVSERDSLSRILNVRSPYADFHIFGDFDYSSFFQDLKGLYKEYKLIFRNDSEEINNYYALNKKDLSDFYYLDYDFHLKNINPVVTMFMPEFILSKNTRLEGTFTGGPAKLVQLETAFDTLRIDRFTFEGNSIKFNTQKNSDTTLVYAKYDISSRKQKIDGISRSEDLNCKVNWDGNLIDFLLNIRQSGSSNYARTAGQIEFLSDTTMMRILPSEINIIDKIWQVSDQNMMMIRKKNYDVRNLSLFHGDQRITFNGVLSDDPNKNLFISIRNFEMQNLNPLISKKLDGIFNGFIDVKDFFDQKQINSRINLRDLTINNFLVGNVVAYSDFDNNREQFDVNLNVTRNGQQTMLIDGIVKPTTREDQLNLDANFTGANLNLIQPFFDDYISYVGGTLDGNLKITGTIGNPVVTGTGTTSGGEFTLDYLNTHYRLDGQVEFAKNYLDFREFSLSDSYNNKGTISGRITHNGFRELEYNFTGNMNKFLVLNTTAKNNSLYYGTAFATGDLRIFGREKVLNITANAISEKGTRFFIPLEGSSEVVQEDFINFLSVHDTLELNDRQDSKKVDLSGINLNFDFEITPDAYCEIIFDLTAGDIIRGRGNGKLNLQIDTKGDFNMFGDYEITEGAYNFTLYNIINKEFVIEPGSNISWIGDPYEAILDIQANYEQLTSLIPILDPNSTGGDDIRNNPDLSRKYPAKVLLDIQGNLSYPEIEFGIDVEGYPKNLVYNGVSIETQMTAFKTKLATDEQELKRQVFSLIILKNFSEENAFNVGGSVEKSVSEFISNQISYWVTQFDENLVVDVDLGSLDNEAFNTFQLRMSYSFLDGRLRVTRDGGFTDQTTGPNVASVLGDWSVEYLLSPDGKLRVKIYNKTNYNTLNPELRSSSTTAGFSLMHTKSFDEIKQLFKKVRDNNRKPETEPQPETKEEEKGISQRIDSPDQY
jgi:hypothetical protein